MKKAIFLLVLVLVFGNALLAQSCLPNGFVFTTQSQVDSFQINNPGCSVIEGNVTIGPENSWDEIDISNLDSLIVLTEIQGDLIVQNNDILPNLTGLDNLTEVGGDLRIETNSSIEDLQGLEQVTQVGGSLIIYGGNFITSLNGLNGLNTIGSDLQITYGNALADISALTTLININGQIEITNNASLSTLQGLENIDAGAISSLTITNNAMLGECAVASVCDYLGFGETNYTISGNSAGCNTASQIINACLTIGVDELSDNEIQLYPNPASDILYISSNDQNKLTEIRLYSQMGQEVLRERNSSSIDISSLAPGIYMIEVEVGAERIKAKLMIE